MMFIFTHSTLGPLFPMFTVVRVYVFDLGSIEPNIVYFYASIFVYIVPNIVHVYAFDPRYTVSSAVHVYAFDLGSMYLILLMFTHSIPVTLYMFTFAPSILGV